MRPGQETEENTHAPRPSLLLEEEFVETPHDEGRKRGEYEVEMVLTLVTMSVQTRRQSPDERRGPSTPVSKDEDIEVALLAKARRSSTLNAAMGPSNTVTGAAKSPKIGTVVLLARSTPLG